VISAPSLCASPAASEQAANTTSPATNYYFKTKDELVAAAIDSHAKDIQAMLGLLNPHRSPQARLKALVRELTGHRELAARYGCPLGSLCSEPDKRTDGLDQECAQLLQLPIERAERQFRDLGRRDARRLERRIDSLA